MPSGYSNLTGLPHIPPSQRGRIANEETRQKLRKAMTGRIMSGEWRNKIAQSKFGDRNPNWNGGIVLKKGYVRVRKDGGYLRQHRFIVSEYIDRKLNKHERIHHIDGNKTNNEINNLYIFRNNYSHIKYHNFLKRHGMALKDSVLPSNLYIYKQ